MHEFVRAMDIYNQITHSKDILNVLAKIFGLK